MRVKCIKLVNPITGKEEESSNWRTVGKVYTVLGISIDNSNNILNYRLISDDVGSPTLSHADQFELVSGYIPSNWSVQFILDKFFEVSPLRWQEIGFWEAYFDGELWAEEIFEEEVAKMIEEEEKQVLA